MKLNGAVLCTAGAEDLSVLTALVNAVGNLGPKTKKHRDEPPDIYLSLGGLTGRKEAPDEHLNWVSQEPLAVGDKVEIEVLESDIADAPKTSSPADPERGQKNVRARYEAAKKEYFALRSLFEPGEP